MENGNWGILLISHRGHRARGVGFIGWGSRFMPATLPTSCFILHTSRPPSCFILHTSNFVISHRGHRARGVGFIGWGSRFMPATLPTSCFILHTSRPPSCFILHTSYFVISHRGHRGLSPVCLCVFCALCASQFVHFVLSSRESNPQQQGLANV